MSEKKDLGTKDTGMCPHGNFPATCKDCNDAKEDPASPAEEKARQVESVDEGLEKIQTQLREMLQSFPPAKKLADNYSLRSEKGYDMWASEIGRLMTLRTEVKILTEDTDQRMTNRHRDTDSTFVLTGLDKIVARLENIISDRDLRDAKEQLTMDLIDKFKKLQETISATQEIIEKTKT